MEGIGLTQDIDLSHSVGWLYIFLKEKEMAFPFIVLPWIFPEDIRYFLPETD